MILDVTWVAHISDLAQTEVEDRVWSDLKEHHIDPRPQTGYRCTEKDNDEDRPPETGIRSANVSIATAAKMSTSKILTCRVRTSPTVVSYSGPSCCRSIGRHTR